MKRILLSILIPVCCACGSSRKTENAMSASRNMFSTEMLKAQTVAIPARKAKLSIPLINGTIAGLPPGASYQARNAHTSVKASIENDTLFIESVCDSIQSTYYGYERISGENENSKIRKNKETETGKGSSLRTILIIISAAIVLLCVYRKQ